MSQAPGCRHSYNDQDISFWLPRMFAAASLCNLRQLPSPFLPSSSPLPFLALSPKLILIFGKKKDATTTRGKPDFKRPRIDVPNASLYLKIKFLVLFLKIKLVKYVCHKNKEKCSGNKLPMVVPVWTCVQMVVLYLTKVIQ